MKLLFFHVHWSTHRGQGQAKVGGLVLHLDLDLVEQRLNSFVLKSVPVSGEVETELKHFVSAPPFCSSHSDTATL